MTLIFIIPYLLYPVPQVEGMETFPPPHFEILFKFKEGVGIERRVEILKSLEACEVKQKDYAPFVSLRLKTRDEKTYNYLKSLREIEYAEWGKWFRIDFIPAVSLDLSFFPNDPYYSWYQWHLKRIGMEEVWDIETGDSTVIIGIIDTGVAYEDRPIPDYERGGVDPSCSTYVKATDLINTRFIPGWDFVYEDSFANDDHGHGTHICGTIAQTTNNNFGCAGIAFDCTIMPIKAFNFLGFGSEGDCAFAIYYATTHGAKIINMSFAQPDEPGQTFRDAIIYAAQNNVIMVAGSGNSSASIVYYPAAYPEVIAVGASTSSTPDSLAFYSNYGTNLELVAPGGDLVNRIPDPGNIWDGIAQQSILFGQFTPSGKAKPDSLIFAVMLGTSCATPHVSGVCGLMLARGIPPGMVREIIDSTCLDLGETGWDTIYGFGRLDAWGALGGRDTVPPQITETTVLYDTTFCGPYYIYSNIRDLFGLTGALLFYKIGSSPYDSSFGENLGGNWYRFVIPQVVAPTVVRYYLKAIDNSVNQNISFDPPTAPQIPYAFAVYVGIAEDVAKKESLLNIPTLIRMGKRIDINSNFPIEVFDAAGRRIYKGNKGLVLNEAGVYFVNFNGGYTLKKIVCIK
uniref:Peptidase S8/S53 domain-containing protein n=1 Tax=candidate division WOR-3 bacterium TaxID=2052148 RepID=A0A7C4TCS0_UNCW3